MGRRIAAVGLVVLALAAGVAAWRTRSGSRPPAPAELRAVPPPDLAALEPAVRDQIQAEIERVATLAADPGADARARGEAYGRLGQVLLAYGLAAGVPALENARDLLADDYRWPYYLGHHYRTQGDLAAAAPAYARALELAPDDIPARVRLAEALAGLHQPEAAKEHLEAVVAREPAHAMAHALLARLAAEGGAPGAQSADTGTARADAGGVDAGGSSAGGSSANDIIRHYEAALASQPGASSLHYPLALAYRDAGDRARAEAHLRQRGEQPVTLSEPLVEALAALKRGANLLVFQGGALLKAGKFAEAAAIYEQAVAADPANAMALLDLGVARYRLDDVQGAIAAVEKAVALDPRGTEGGKVHFSLGVYLSETGQPERAEAALRRAVALDPQGAGAVTALANLLRRGDRCAEAVDLYGRGLELQPAAALTRVQQALCLVDLSRAAEARAALEAAHAAFPDDIDIADALARVLAAAPADGVRDGRRALALAEANAARRESSDVLETLAMAQAENGDFDAAVASQQRALDLAVKQSRTEWAAALRSQLAAYRAHQPSRTPWPAFLYRQ